MQEGVRSTREYADNKIKKMWQYRVKRDRIALLDVVTGSLLQLDQSPAPSLGVVDFIRDTSQSDGVGDQLHLVIRTSG